MEKSCLSLSMRFPPPIIRTFVSPLYPIPTSSLFFSNKTHKFSSLFYSSSSCALAIESENKKSQIYSEFREKPSNFRKNPQNLSEFNEKPINFWGSGVLESKLGTKKNRNLGIRNFNGNLTVKWCSEKLKNCALNLLLNEGREIHGRIIKIGLETDMHFWVSLINFYAKCGCLDFARKVLDGMSERDVVSWTALIGGFVANGYGLDGVLLFREMQREGITPNEFTLATVLKAISMCSELYIGKQVHAFVVKLGEFSDIYLGSSLVDLYSKCGDMDYAKKVFVRIPELNVVSWNALLNGYAKRGDKDEMMRILWDMNKSNIKLSEYNLSTVIEGLANSGDLLAGEVVHCVAIKMGFELDEFVSSTLVDLYSKCGIASHALKVFKRIRSPDIVAWTSMISCLDQQDHKQEALKLFCLMTDAGLRPNQYTLASLISAAIDSNLKICKSIHACVYKYAFEAENVVCNAMITMYMKNGSIHYGRLIFDKMSYRDVISWNALLSGFHNCEICDQGPKIFNRMLLEGFKPNSYTFISVLRCCSSLRNICFGKQLHACIIKGSFVEDEFVGTALLDMYAKCDKLECAELVFDRLKCRDLFTWTVIISCYAQNDEGEKAIRSFMEMQKEGANPNEFTLASCLRACAGISSLENGRLLHSWAIKSGHVYDIFVGSSVIDMYGKCGCIEDAESFFEALDFRDAVAWNTIICGYSQHGFGYKSLQSFKAMLEEGILPDKITFLGILSACSHVGLIEEGKKYFNSMEEVYGVVPSVEHYACMIDILGRGGQFDELDTFIKDMKTEPDALIWETVLGACKIHGNLELGKRAAEKVFALEPEIDSNYILLSNIFAAKGNWVDVSKVRALMSSHGVKKEPGCSWVSVDNKTHVFLSQDSSHPMRMEIYKRLEELGEKLDTAGYSPDTNYVFHDMNDREKKENMLHHSEKLALAFALISHSPCKTIRIFKNLRICRDCHEFMKLASRITNREIVVRDIKRFHHFRDGNCTCADYW